MGEKGGTTFQAPEPPDPIAVAVSDFIFNRVNQFTPSGSLQFFAPGQAIPSGALRTTQPILQGLTQTASNLFGGASPPPAPAPNTQQGSVPQAPASGGVPPSFNPLLSILGLSPQSFGGGGSGQNFPGNAEPTQVGATDFVLPPGGGPAGNINIPAPIEGGDFTLNFGNLRNATAVQQLSPALQNLENARLTSDFNTIAQVLDRQQGLADLPEFVTGLNLEGLPQGTGLNTSGLPGTQSRINDLGLPGLPQDIEGFRQDTIDAVFSRGSELLNRNFDENLETIEQRLANRGFDLDASEGASRQFGEFAESRQDALNNLALDSIIQGGQESSRILGDTLRTRGQGFGERVQNEQLARDLRTQLLGEQQAVQGFDEQLRGARLGEQLQNANLQQTARLGGINELNALLGLQQVGAPGLQNFLPTTPTGVTDAFGLNLSGQASRAQSQAALKGSKLEGLSNLGNAGITAAF